MEIIVDSFRIIYQLFWFADLWMWKLGIRKRNRNGIDSACPVISVQSIVLKVDEMDDCGTTLAGSLFAI